MLPPKVTKVTAYQVEIFSSATKSYMPYGMPVQSQERAEDIVQSLRSDNSSVDCRWRAVQVDVIPVRYG